MGSFTGIFSFTRFFQYVFHVFTKHFFQGRFFSEWILSSEYLPSVRPTHPELSCFIPIFILKVSTETFVHITLIPWQFISNTTAHRLVVYARCWYFLQKKTCTYGARTELIAFQLISIFLTQYPWWCPTFSLTLLSFQNYIPKIHRGMKIKFHWSSILYWCTYL